MHQMDHHVGRLQLIVLHGMMKMELFVQPYLSPTIKNFHFPARSSREQYSISIVDDFKLGRSYSNRM